MQPLPAVAPGALDFPWLKAFDFKASWPIKLKERIAIEPSVSIFNLFNFSNAFLPGNLPTATLGTPTSVGEVTPGRRFAVSCQLPVRNICSGRSACSSSLA